MCRWQVSGGARTVWLNRHGLDREHARDCDDLHMFYSARVCADTCWREGQLRICLPAWESQQSDSKIGHGSVPASLAFLVISPA